MSRSGGKSSMPMLHEGPLTGLPPVTILDKSAFQGLARREHSWFHHYFFENITPVLVYEIVGDLAKIGGDKPPAQKVQELAQKIGGSGNRTNLNYRALCLMSLMGGDVPMTGDSLIEQPQLFREADGTVGAFVEVGPLNQLLMKLASGRSDDVDRAFAEKWRATCASLSLDGLKDFLRRNQIVLMKARSPEEIPGAVNAALAVPSLQNRWAELLLALTKAGPRASAIISRRWSVEGEEGLSQFAPYAHHCLRALVMLFVACRDGFLKMQPTHLIDLQYLYYLPFCSVFSSEDRVHVLLAPLLARPNQSFVRATEFKRGLRAVSDFLDSRSERERRWIRYALAMYPPPLKANSVTGLWLKHGRRWDSSLRNYAIDATPSDTEQALSYVEGLFREAELDVPQRVPVPAPWNDAHASAIEGSPPRL